MSAGKEHIAGLQAALDLWNDGGPSVQYAHALADMIEQARAGVTVSVAAKFPYIEYKKVFEIERPRDNVAFQLISGGGK